MQPRFLFPFLTLVSLLPAAEVTHVDIQQVREYIPHNILAPGEVLHGRVSLGDTEATHLVTVRWFDAFGRLAGISEARVVAPARGVDFAIPLVNPLSWYNRLEVLLDGVVSSRGADFFIRPARREWDDYHAVLWSDHEFETFGLLRDAGINGQIVYKDFPYFRESIAAGMESYVDNLNWRVFSPYHKWRPKWHAMRDLFNRDPYNMYIKVRSPSFEDPATDEALENTTRAIVSAHKGHRPLFYNLADEIGIGDQSAPIDLDHSYFARNAFIAYLRNRYRSLVALNEQWDTRFDSFYEAARSTLLLTDGTMDRVWKLELPKVFNSPGDAADRFGLSLDGFDQYVDLYAALKSTPPRSPEAIQALLPGIEAAFPGRSWTPEDLVAFAAGFHQWTLDHAVEDIRGWNLSPWMDHKDFMDLSMAKALARARDFGRKEDPDGLFGYTGGHGPGALSGYNLYYLSRSVDVQIPYNISSDVEIIRSVAKDTILMSPTWHSDEKGVRKLWYRFFHGDRGVLFWDNDEPDNTFLDKEAMTLTDRARNYAPDLRELTNGLGKLVINAQRQHDGVAVLYSQASLRAHWMIQHLNLGREWRRESWHEFGDLEFGRLYPSVTKLLEDNFLQYDFIYSDQLAEGGLESGDYRVLILPQAIALSGREIEQIRRFVGRGGFLVADQRPALMDVSGKVRPRGALDDVFGIESTLEFSNGTNKVVPATATELGIGEGDDVIVYTHAFGRGAAFYLDTSLLEYYVARTMPPRGEALLATMRDVLERCGVKPLIQVETVSGDRLGGMELVRYRNGGQTYLALFRNPRSRESGIGGAKPIDNSLFEGVENVRISLPSDLQVYDVRQKTDLGRTREFTCVLDPWRPSLFTLSPDPVNLLPVSPSLQALKSGESLSFNVRLDAKSAPGDSTIRVINMQVAGPDGEKLPHYRRNKTFSGDATQIDQQFALNDPPGEYRFVFTHVSTGAEEEVLITVRESQ